jgi:hypothetical protein
MKAYASQLYHHTGSSRLILPLAMGTSIRTGSRRRRSGDFDLVSRRLRVRCHAERVESTCLGLSCSAQVDVRLVSIPKAPL